PGRPLKPGRSGSLRRFDHRVGALPRRVRGLAQGAPSCRRGVGARGPMEEPTVAKANNRTTRTTRARPTKAPKVEAPKVLPARGEGDTLVPNGDADGDTLVVTVKPEGHTVEAELAAVIAAAPPEENPSSELPPERESEP